MTLRPYQLEAVEAIWANMVDHVYASLPTGSGKSHVLAEICRRALEFEGTRIVVLCPSKELIEQNAEKIKAVLPWTDVAIYCAGLREKRIGTVTVASVQSLYNIKDIMPDIDLFVVDEAHLVPHDEVGRYRGIFAAKWDARVIGLTATPYRMRGGLLHQGEDALFVRLVHECKTSDLIDQGYLSPVRAREGKGKADTSNLHIRAGEFMSSEMTAAFDRNDLTSAAVADIMVNAFDRDSIMVFCCSIAHCEHVAAAFRSKGEHSVRVLTGQTNHHDRREMISDFKSKRIRVLVNCQVLTTGFDAPNVDCIALLRATASPGLYVQIVGRGLRVAPGKKDCLLLDYGENVARHGPLDLITAERIEKGEGAAPTKTCPDCESIIFAGFTVCPHCGHIFQVEQQEFPALTTKASARDPIKGVLVESYEVSDVDYYRHQKPGKPPSLRVEYRVGIGRYIKEWVCVEHEGYARQKASAWFARRGVPMPSTVDCALAVSTQLVKPKSIKVKNDGKYNEVISYAF